MNKKELTIRLECNEIEIFEKRKSSTYRFPAEQTDKHFQI